MVVCGPVSVATHDGAIYGTSTIDGYNLASDPVKVLLKNAVGFNRQNLFGQ